jgi:hypothetical protein
MLRKEVFEVNVPQDFISPISPTGATRAKGSRLKRHGIIPLKHAVAIVPGASPASEFGIGTYHSGLVDLLAGFMAPPGTLISTNRFVYRDGRAGVVVFPLYAPSGSMEEDNWRPGES